MNDNLTKLNPVYLPKKKKIQTVNKVRTTFANSGQSSAVTVLQKSPELINDILYKRATSKSKHWPY